MERLALLACALAAGCVLDWPPPPEPVEQPVPWLPKLKLPSPGDCELCPTMASEIPAPSGATHQVNQGDDLQLALQEAEPGDEVVLEAGATFTGPIQLPVKNGDAYITVRTADMESLPGACTRLGVEHLASLPRIIGPRGEPALVAGDGAHHYRFVGIELTVEPHASSPSAVVELGRGDVTDVNLLPHDIELDRVHVRGATEGPAHGILLHAHAVTVRNSRIAAIGGPGRQLHALIGHNGPGPFRILNSYLESYAATIRFGEYAPAITGLVPADIEVRASHLSRDTAWKTGAGPWYGTRWIQLENARAVTVEGNLFDESWDAYSIDLSGDMASGRGVADVTVLSNTFIGGHDLAGAMGDGTIDAITLRNNLVLAIEGRLITMHRPVSGLTIEHNTVRQTAHIFYSDLGNSTDFVFRDNIVNHNEYGMWCASFGVGTDCLEGHFAGYDVQKNVIVGLPATITPAEYPPDNFFPSYDVGFVDEAGGDYRLAPASPYKGAASDGTDIGVDFAALAAAAACRTP